MTTLASLHRPNSRSKSLSVETRTNPPAQAYSRILTSPAPASPFLRALSDSGKGRAIAQPALAKGFRRKEASSPGDFTLCRQFRRIRIYGPEILRIELRIIGKNLLLGGSIRKPLKNLLNRNAVAAYAGFPKPYVRIDRDPIEKRTGDVRHLLWSRGYCIVTMTSTKRPPCPGSRRGYAPPNFRARRQVL